VARRAGIKDVAALAGVSPATVSRALNENLSTLVAPGTRARVQAAAESLEYSANPLAVGMQKGRSSVVALVIDSLSDAYLAGRMIDGAQRALWNRGMLLAVTSAAGGPERVDRVFKRLYERRVDGLVYAATSYRTVDVVSDLPLVLLNAEPRGSQVPFVVPDETGGADTAVTELLYAGHKRIGFVAPERTQLTSGRYCGYIRALARLGLPEDPELIIFDDAATAKGGRRTVGRLLQLAAKPTAVLCHNKEMALGAYQSAQDLGLDVPRDLSVIAFDNDDPAGAEALSPALTTVALPHFEMGSRAAHVILDVIGEPRPTVEQEARTLVSCYLNRRNSVAEPL